ncbi:MAG: GNAT family N-acetyltransferase [Pseudomonadota bacterium]
MTRNKSGFRLVRCDVLGRLTEPVSNVPETFLDHARGSADHYAVVGFTVPWVSYGAVYHDRIVGGGAFMGAPINGTVEIGFFTLGLFERQGFGTATARALVNIARRTEPCTIVTAKTAPERSASTRVLRKLRFYQNGHILDTHLKKVLLWQLKL